MAVSPILADLDASVTRSTTVMGSASILIRGIDARIEAAKAEALKNGATEAELAPFAALHTALSASEADLSAAIVENTPSAGEPPTQPSDPPPSERRR